MAMLKNKHITFSLILVCLAVVSPMAKAQLGGIGGIGGILGGIIPIPTVTGRVTCSVNASVNGTAPPPFPNATVQLQCGPLNTVVATTTTDSNGVFMFSPTQTALSTLISSCRVFIPTTLNNCNATLPPVMLTSPLQIVGSLVTGLLNFIPVTPTGLIPSVPLPIN